MSRRQRHPVCANCGRRHRLDRSCEHPDPPQSLRRKVTPVGELFRGSKR